MAGRVPPKSPSCRLAAAVIDGVISHSPGSQQPVRGPRLSRQPGSAWWRRASSSRSTGRRITPAGNGNRKPTASPPASAQTWVNVAGSSRTNQVGWSPKTRPLVKKTGFCWSCPFSGSRRDMFLPSPRLPPVMIAICIREEQCSTSFLTTKSARRHSRWLTLLPGQWHSASYGT